MWAAAAGRRVASVVLRRSWESLCTQGQRALFTAGFRECEDRSDNDRMRERGGAAEVIARGWQVSPESESDWRSHAAAVARSIDLIKARLEVIWFATALSGLGFLRIGFFGLGAMSSVPSAMLLCSLLQQFGQLCLLKASIKSLEFEDDI